jgi:hypothetical protein
MSHEPEIHAVDFDPRFLRHALAWAVSEVQAGALLVPAGGGRMAERASAVNQRRDQTTNEFLDYLLS